MRTRVKICGVTRPEDGLAAARCGADAIGLVFYPQSVRAVRLSAAIEIAAGLPPFVALVALFVNAAESEVREVVDGLPVELLQFHGDEDPVYCERFGVPYMKAVRVRGPDDVAQAAERYPRARALLLDAHRPGQWGGTGRTFDWSLAHGRTRMPVVLAGGLVPGNVGEAVRAVRPHAVDVSGGVEQAPGIKDAGLIKAFIDEVNGVEAG